MRPRITFQSGDSLLHRLHPLLKFAWLLLGTVVLFVVHNPWLVLGVLGLALLAFPACRLRWRGIRGARLLLTTALLLAVLQVAFVHEGPALLRIGPVVITLSGVHAAVYVAGRFASVVLVSYLFVLTTVPTTSLTR